MHKRELLHSDPYGGAQRLQAARQARYSAPRPPPPPPKTTTKSQSTPKQNTCAQHNKHSGQLSTAPVKGVGTGGVGSKPDGPTPQRIPAAPAATPAPVRASSSVPTTAPLSPPPPVPALPLLLPPCLRSSGLVKTGSLAPSSAAVVVLPGGTDTRSYLQGLGVWGSQGRGLGGAGLCCGGRLCCQAGAQPVGAGAGGWARHGNGQVGGGGCACVMCPVGGGGVGGQLYVDAAAGQVWAEEVEVERRERW